MAAKFTIEGKDYRTSDLSENGKMIWEHLLFTLKTLEELNAKHALMSRAKNGYIADLKDEVVEQKTGLNLSDLFMED
tara:strand:+ start:622 stop:852 length:231 start_codon:yes stop_codon:yes gene_type:complete